MAATPQEARELSRIAYNASCEAAGLPTIEQEVAAATAPITSQLDTAISEADTAEALVLALQTKLDNARVAAQAEKDLDAAHVAGQSVLDALQ